MKDPIWNKQVIEKIRAQQAMQTLKDELALLEWFEKITEQTRAEHRAKLAKGINEEKDN